MSLASCVETACQFAALMLVQSTLLIVGAYLIVMLLRLKDAALLSVVYRSVLLAILLAPPATLVMMHQEIAGWWPTSWSNETLLAHRVPHQLASATSQTRTAVVSPDSQESVTLSPESANLLPTATEPRVEGPSVVAPVASRFPDVAYPAKFAFCLAWAGISALLLVRVWRVHRQLCRTLAKAVPAESSIQNCCDQLAITLEVTPPRVVCSPYFSSPFLAGLLRPTVHLPSDGMNNEGPARTDGLRDILIHELAHLKRRDNLMRLLSQLLVASFFFQPLIQRLVRWLDSSAEDVCDDYAMSLGASRDHYAERLVDLAELCDFPLTSAVGIASGRSALKHRVERIMDASRQLSTGVSRGILATCGLITIAAITTVCLLLVPAGGSANGTQVTETELDMAFAKLTALDNAVHKEERQGLIFAIHQAKRFENGGVMVMASVRGTEETLRRYPPTERMIAPGDVVTDGLTRFCDRPVSRSDRFRLLLAEASHRGVDAQWWMWVPRGRMPTWFADKDGKVPLEIVVTPQGEFAEDNHTDERGVCNHIYWTPLLEIPASERLPPLKEIAAGVHADLSRLGDSCPSAYLGLGVDLHDETESPQFGSVADVSMEEYAKAILRHWQTRERLDIDRCLRGGYTLNYRELGGLSEPSVNVDYYSIVDDETLRRATERPNLAEISARRTRITDSGLIHLNTLKQLRELDLASTSITDSGLLHLESMTSLEHLNVADTKVTRAGIERLQRSLPHLVVETELSAVQTPPEIKSGALPSKASGLVIDSEGHPIRDAQVTVLVRTFNNEGYEERNDSQVWTAVTDNDGRYAITSTGSVHPSAEVRIKVVAEGFADVSDGDYERKNLTGALPTVRMCPGRRITGRLANVAGAAVNKAIVRFQASREDGSLNWDSGPFPVGPDGRFSLSIPADSLTAGAIYPQRHAPRFIDVTSAADQGNIVLEDGVALKGRVIDKSGRGVAHTVVEISKTERRILAAFLVPIGTAVETDGAGYFQLPPLSGEYKLSVVDSAPDYSRQTMLTGRTPPPFKPLTMDFKGSTVAREILLKESTP